MNKKIILITGVGFTVLNRPRAEMLHRVGLGDLLRPRARAEA
jgi:hypothetical protein